MSEMSDSDDYMVERYFAPDQLVNEGPRAVKITHKASGVTACSESARTSVQNTALAVREIEEALAIGEQPAAVDTDSISDGCHTFGELYEHCAALLIALMHSHPEISWFAPVHHDGTMFGDGWFIAGMDLPTGQITYHLRTEPWWRLLTESRAQLRPRAPEYDGHDSRNVICRLFDWVKRDSRQFDWNRGR